MAHRAASSFAVDPLAPAVRCMPVAYQLFFLVLALVMFSPLAAWSQCPGLTTQVAPFASEQLLISDVAKPLTPSVYKPSGITPAMATISIASGVVNYNVIGTPTASTGHPASGTILICGYDNISAFRAIRITTDAMMTITYYKTK